MHTSYLFYASISRDSAPVPGEGERLRVGKYTRRQGRRNTLRIAMIQVRFSSAPASNMSCLRKGRTHHSPSAESASPSPSPSLSVALSACSQLDDWSWWGDCEYAHLPRWGHFALALVVLVLLLVLALALALGCGPVSASSSAAEGYLGMFLTWRRRRPLPLSGTLEIMLEMEVGGVEYV